MTDAKFYSFEAKTIDGKTVPFSEFKNKVVVIVNVASKCGFTNQYKGLEDLYQKHKSQGLVILGFPCNQFAGQEPGSDEEIKNFCSLNYNVSFPLFAKVDVNGAGTHPVYQYLKKEEKGLLGSEAIKWNFTKFLVNREGQPLKRFSPQTEPQALEEDIEAALKSEPKLG